MSRYIRLLIPNCKLLPVPTAFRGFSNGSQPIIINSKFNKNGDMMALHKHEIPLFEYDDCLTAVLAPDHEQLELQLPEKALHICLEIAKDC